MDLTTYYLQLKLGHNDHPLLGGHKIGWNPDWAEGWVQICSISTKSSKNSPLKSLVR